MLSKNSSVWKKYHKFQEKPGWCGPAVIQMVLARVGINKSQAEITKSVYKKWWGTPQQMILAYLSKFFKIVNYKQSAALKDLSFHLKKGNIIIVNWWDDLDGEFPEGHYSIVGDYSSKLKSITLVDPTNARSGIWTIKSTEFNKRWYDTLDTHDRTWVEGWMLWIDPKSKI
jgi:ABC-type bacteriocin/lantibiotic exporter with double-glycine peptidase domain